MIIIAYKNKKLARYYTDRAFAEKELGRKLARKYVSRVEIIKACTTEYDLKKIKVLRFHALEGKLKGLYSIDLYGKTRLWLRIKKNDKTIITIERVYKEHYGK